MIEYIILIFIKIFDNIIGTGKSIATYMNKKLLSSILVVLSQLMFYMIIKQVIADDSLITIIIISVASGVGNYIAFAIADKFKADTTWQNIVTSSDKEMLVGLATFLKLNNIKYLLFDTYNRSFNESYTLMIFSKTKSESRLIDEYLSNSNVAYLRMINGEEVEKI